MWWGEGRLRAGAVRGGGAIPATESSVRMAHMLGATMCVRARGINCAAPRQHGSTERHEQGGALDQSGHLWRLDNAQCGEHAYTLQLIGLVEDKLGMMRQSRNTPPHGKPTVRWATGGAGMPRHT